MSFFILLLFKYVIFLKTVSTQNTYYASTSGSGTTCSSSSPCSLIYAVETKASNGDTVLLKNGTYSNLPCKGGGCTDGGQSKFNNAIDVPTGVTVKSESPRQALLEAQSSGGFYCCGVIGAYSSDNVVVDSLTIKGTVMAYNCQGFVLKNSEIYNGAVDYPSGVSSDDFGNNIRLEKVDSADIYNNYFHDNVHINNLVNDPIVMIYATTMNIFQNTFKGGVSSHIRLKDGPKNVKIFRNLFIDSGQYECVMGPRQDQFNYGISGNEIYQNIFIDCNGGVGTDSHAENPQIYSNTFYNSCDGRGAMNMEGGDASWWNNIVSCDTGPFFFTESRLTNINYLNYNNYHNLGSADWVYNYGTHYSSLSAWKTATGQELNSITSDPGFTNPGGFKAEDYKRSSYPEDGTVRSPGTSAVLGAYITGNEQIGHNWGDSNWEATSCPPTPSGSVCCYDIKYVGDCCRKEDCSNNYDCVNHVCKQDNNKDDNKDGDLDNKFLTDIFITAGVILVGMLAVLVSGGIIFFAVFKLLQKKEKKKFAGSAASASGSEFIPVESDDVVLNEVNK